MESNWFIVTALSAIFLFVCFLIRLTKRDRIKIEKELNYLREIEEAETKKDSL